MSTEFPILFPRRELAFLPIKVPITENSAQVIPMITLGNRTGWLSTPILRTTARASMLVAIANITKVKPREGSRLPNSSSFREKAEVKGQAELVPL